MKRRQVISGAIVSIVLGATVTTTAHALSSTVVPCQEAVAKSGLKFVTKKLKTIQKCREKNMKSPGDCLDADLNASIAALVTKLNDGLAKKCGPPFNPLGLSALPPIGIGFPGKCPQGSVGNFTFQNLTDCIGESHENAIDGGDAISAAVDSLIEVEWGATTANADSGVQKCQKEIDKDGGKVLKAVLKAVQKCRNAINKGGPGIAANCATADPKAASSITKAESKAIAGITGKCTLGQILALDVCNPQALTPAAAAACVVSTHHLIADDPSPTSGDLIDFEYAAPPACGDGATNQPSEECDGADDGACTAGCGAFDGPFACLCLDVPRERIIEHSNSDLDNGWSGQSHDSGVVEGGGYVVNLYDCDSDDSCGDDLCTVGASCELAPHFFCNTNAYCQFFGQGNCRTDITDVGPHCIQNVQTVCTSNADCTGTGNYCLKTFHGPPLPLSAGGISVCVLNVFSQNVIGTKDVSTGSGAVDLRQKSITHLTGLASMPCPVCGGWCEAPPGLNGSPGNRHTCTTNADCADVGPAHHCVTDSVCNFGPNADKTCRGGFPFGGPTILFGNPSVDCPPNPTTDISGGGLDIHFAPATTGTVKLLPSYQCDDGAFSGKTCAGGTNNGAQCTAASECPGGQVCTDPALCPGGVGTSPCSHQCYCPIGGAVQQKPNGCDAACVGGGSDGFPCTDPSDCVGGFCHLGDCRPDSTADPVLQPNEGACSTTVEGHCTVSGFRTCDTNADCVSPACPTCQPGEYCNVVGKNCFVNAGTTSSGLTRTGAPDPTDSRSASIFCIARTGTGSVDATAGLPGPGALIQPQTTVHTGLTDCP